MTKRDALNLLADMVAEFIFEGGDPRALAGHDRLHVLELADALDKLGSTAEARIVRNIGSKMTYPS
jgi:hypothetical protein